MRRIKLLLTGAVLMLASSVSMAGGGGCLQGTWTYFDDQGDYVGSQTVGCGDADGTWGQVTDNRSFSQGCSSPI